MKVMLLTSQTLLRRESSRHAPRAVAAGYGTRSVPTTFWLRLRRARLKHNLSLKRNGWSTVFLGNGVFLFSPPFRCEQGRGEGGWGRLRRRTLCPLEIDAMKDACYASPHAATSHKGFGDSRQDSMVKLRIAHSAYSSRWPWRPLQNVLYMWRVGRPVP